MLTTDRCATWLPEKSLMAYESEIFQRNRPHQKKSMDHFDPLKVFSQFHNQMIRRSPS